jgi:integrase
VDQTLHPAEDGRTRRFRRQGFPTSGDASEFLDKVRALLSIPAEKDTQAQIAVSDLLEACGKSGEPLPELAEVTRRYAVGVQLSDEITVGEWLDLWLESKKAIKPTTLRSYKSHTRFHLKPHLGDKLLGKLRVTDVQAMFNAIAKQNEAILLANAERRTVKQRLKATPNKGKEARALRKELNQQLIDMPGFQRITGASQHNIQRTLRAALNSAIARQIIPAFNVASHVELPAAKPRRAMLWTPERIRQWEKTGERPSPVMVWPPDLIGQFLDFTADHRLYALFHTIAFRGLRRGEACGVRWSDLDEESSSLTVAVQIVQDGWDVYEGIPKTDAGNRYVALDRESLSNLQQQRVCQKAEFTALGLDPESAVRIFTDAKGQDLHPGKLTDLFERQVALAGLPPIRLHDLRHCAATLALKAKVDIKIVSRMLGHSSTTITREIYQSVITELFHQAAEDVVALVPRARRSATAEV